MKISKEISCCGVICSGCGYYMKDCKGCNEIKGEVFWCTFSGENVCSIYECCVNKNSYKTCAECDDLPCSLYMRGDPTKTKEENEADLKMQLKNLRV